MHVTFTAFFREKYVIKIKNLFVCKRNELVN